MLKYGVPLCREQAKYGFQYSNPLIYNAIDDVNYLFLSSSSKDQALYVCQFCTFFVSY